MNINQEIFAFGKKGIHIFIQPTVAPSMSSCEIPDKATMSKRGKHQKDLDSHIAYINIKKKFYPKILGYTNHFLPFTSVKNHCHGNHFNVLFNCIYPCSSKPTSTFQLP